LADIGAAGSVLFSCVKAQLATHKVKIMGIDKMRIQWNLMELGGTKSDQASLVEEIKHVE
jgi:hypothetical protein